jgi:hypothetical protein
MRVAEQMAGEAAFCQQSKWVKRRSATGSARDLERAANLLQQSDVPIDCITVMAHQMASRLMSITYFCRI